MSNSEAPRYRIGFDLGGTKMLCVVYDENFEPVGRRRRKTKGYRGKEAGLARMLETIDQAIENAGLTREQISSIGMACPGPLRLQEGVIKQAPNLGWTDVPVKKTVEDEFGFPLIMCNDVDAGVYGETKFGAGDNERCVIGVFPGTGIGGGCVYEGKMLIGADHSAMELGHMQVMPDGPLCGCGLHGCLEAVASRLAIAGAVAQAAYRGQAPYVLENAGTDLSNIRSGVLAGAIEAGDKVVAAILRRAAHFIGVAVGGMVHLLSPDVVILGGGLIEAMPQLFVDEVWESAKAKTIASYRDSFTVRAAELGDDSTVMGAAAWASEVLGENVNYPTRKRSGKKAS